MAYFGIALSCSNVVIPHIDTLHIFHMKKRFDRRRVLLEGTKIHLDYIPRVFQQRTYVDFAWQQLLLTKINGTTTKQKKKISKKSGKLRPLLTLSV